MGCATGCLSAFLPVTLATQALMGQPGYLALGAGHAEGQLVQQLPRWFLQVPPLNLQGIRGGSASPECTGHFDVVALPYSHIFGDFGKCS